MNLRILTGLVAGIALWAGASPAAAQAEQSCSNERAAAAERGVTDDMDVALCLLESASQQDKAQAAQMLKRLGDAGDPDALQGYAIAVLRGIGVPADQAEGQRLMEQAAAAGSGGAMLTLAQHYWDDNGFYPKDEAKALALKTQAAETGGFKGPTLGEIQWEIGMHHLKGEGTNADQQVAYRWVAKGAENGSTSAMISRAVMLATAEGVAEDDAAARGWYQKAVDAKDKNLGHALRGLGFMMFTGEGGREDVTTACTYTGAAVILDDENARQLLGIIIEDMTEEARDACFNRAMAYLRAAVPDRFEE